MSTTFASHDLPRRWRSQQAIFVGLLALAIAVGLYGVLNNSFDAVDPVGVGPVSALPNGIDPALVEGLASNYPPVEQASAYRAAATATKAASDQAFVEALASNYPPIENAAAYRAAAA